MALSTSEYLVAQRRKKYWRQKSKHPFDRVVHLRRVGVQTQFKPGELIGSKNPRWKGGYYFRIYGITSEDYDAMLLAQDGRCAVCGRPPKKRRLCVDHDHKTRRVRGLLCFRCNYGLSWFQEDAGRLMRAGAYLQKFL